MISISKLLCDLDAEGDGLRYDAPSSKPQISERKQRRPVVVWNVTKRCNLSCEHCYAAAACEPAPGELSAAEGMALLDDLADYGIPVVLFSGGEPTMRPDLPELVAHAADRGIRPVLSTNGTLLTRDRVEELVDAGIAYVGVSVDGLRERNDAFRGQDGAFEAAVDGIETCLEVGVKTGLRYTITERTAPDMEPIVDLLTDVGVDRFCFYHLDYGGRGADIADCDLEPAQKRAAVRRLCDLTLEYHEAGEEIETLLVGNYADTPVLVEYARERFGDDHANRVFEYLERNGGDPAGERVADIDYQGNVHLTQFWQGYSLGNVRDRPFSAIWEDDHNPLLSFLRNREDFLTGACADCAYKSVCRGGSRLRALAANGNLTAPDPQCSIASVADSQSAPADD